MSNTTGTNRWRLGGFTRLTTLVSALWLGYAVIRPFIVDGPMTGAEALITASAVSMLGAVLLIGPMRPACLLEVTQEPTRVVARRIAPAPEIVGRITPRSDGRQQPSAA